MKKKDIKDKIKKLAENPLVKQAAGLLEFSAGLYKQLPSGLLVPLKAAGPIKHGDVVTQLDKKSAKLAKKAALAAQYKIDKDAWYVTDELVSNSMFDPDQMMKLMKDLQTEAEKKTGVNFSVVSTKYSPKDMFPGKVFFDDPPIKFEDGQQVPAHIANDPAIAPVPYTATQALADIAAVKKPYKGFQIWANDLKPSDYNVLGVVAYELAHGLYKENPQKASITTESGIEITNSLLEEPSFTYHLKIGLAKHTEKQKQAAAMAKAAAAYPPPAEGQLDPLAIELCKVMGISEEEYKKWMVGSLPEKAEPVAITQGAFNALLKPGLAASFKEFYGKSITEIANDFEDEWDPKNQNQLSDVALAKEQEELSKASLEKMEKAISYAAKYGMAQLTDKFVTAQERVRVLETIVAGILLAPREMKITDDSFVVSPSTLGEMSKVFNVKVVKKKGDYHVTLE